MIVTIQISFKMIDMKGLMKMMGVTVVFAMLTSCIVHSHPGRRGAPPGQVKKVYVQKRGHGHGHYKHKPHHHRHRR
ncbi:hypothetical protein [Chryseobacterium taihuense]|uniref:Quinol oxidase subunit 4 n=1 Tax=Chryseobacterium taihuense TaxID=1141221 RepID=A0ABY0QU16_9FLAO|nr:hypothetical protein [Chryseobacterium taihuense]SDL90573.1 hypothetical protein SAMN05216273_108107 [Chryseobacterium taihuense]